MLQREINYNNDLWLVQMYFPSRKPQIKEPYTYGHPLDEKQKKNKENNTACEAVVLGKRYISIELI